MTGKYRMLVSLAFVLALTGWIGDAYAYPQYKNPSTGSGNCSSCHGSFTDSTSPKGTVLPSNSKHEMHRAAANMATSCNLCHSSTDGYNPFMSQSAGVGTVQGRGCVGCHEPLGLRKHHASNGITLCAGCHNDTGLTPPPENVAPPYYGTAYTRARNPANPVAAARTNENWSIGDFLGLDNDGDNLYDMADPDNAPPSRTLTVVSAYGGASPGNVTVNSGTAVSERVTNSPAAGPVGIRYVCTGGTVAGNAFTLVNATNVTLTLTNNATLTWLWKTQFLWTVTAGANGAVVATNGWYDSGAAVSARAVANSGYSFTGWTGDVTSSLNPLALTLTGARSVTANFAVNQYTITASAGLNGTISPSGAVLVTQGASQSFTFIPAAGYHVADVLVDGVSAGAPTSYTFSSVAANHTIAASFAIDQKTLTVVSAYGGASPGNVTVNSGTAVSERVTNSPAAGPVGIRYVCTGGTVAGNAFTLVNATNVTLTLTNNATLTWLWKTQFLWTVTAGANGAVVATNGWYDSGAAVSATATANSGYYFTGWTGDVTSSLNPLALTLTGARSVTANFAVNPVTQFTITASAGANGSISPGGAVLVTQGASQSFTFTPATGYHVSDVLVDGVSVGAPASYTFSSVAANHTIAANFAIDQKTLTVASAYGGASPGNVTVNSGTAVSERVTNSPAAGPVGVRYVCAGGTVAGNAFTSVNATNVTLTLTNNATLTWLWKTQFLWTVTAGANGAVVATNGWYDSGAAVSARAVANSGYSFTGWTGDVTSSLNPLALTLTGARSVTANFAVNPVTQFTITASAGANGSISPGGAVLVTQGASQSFTFTPAAGYHVSDVLVDGVSVGAPVSYTFTSVAADHTIAASFVLTTGPSDNLALASRGSTIKGSNGANWDKLIDGVTAGYTGSAGYGYTLWTGVSGAPGTMTLDLKNVCTISGMRMLLWNLDSRSYRYKIEASMNGRSWTLVVDRTTGNWQGWQDLPFGTPIQARYLRLTGTHNTVNRGFHVVEWQVFGTAPANLALASRGSTITGSNGANWDDLIDGVASRYSGTSGYGYTIWTGVPGAPGFMTLDMKSVCAISGIKMLLWNLDNRYYRYKIEASVNSSSWTPVVNRTEGEWRGWQDLSFGTLVKARYLRLTGTYNTANRGFHVVEWQVYGTAGVTPTLAGLTSPPSPGAKTFLGTGGPIGGNLLVLPDSLVIMGSGTGKDGTPLATAEPLDVESQQGKSDWPNAMKAVDLDETTAWTGTYTNGVSWLTVTYPAAKMAEVEVVLAGGSSTNLTLLGSTDGKTLFDLKRALANGPVTITQLWLVFPAHGTELLPMVKEIYVRQQE